MRQAMDGAGYSTTSVGGQRDEGNVILMAVHVVEGGPARWNFSAHKIVNGEVSASFTIRDEDVKPSLLAAYETRLLLAIEMLESTWSS